MMALMNCMVFDDIVDDLVGGEVMGDGTRAAAIAHIRECPSCAARFEDRQWLAASLKQLASDSCREEAPAPLETLLRTRFREQVSLAGRQRKHRRWVATAALAACVLIVIAGAVWFRSSIHTRPDPGLRAQFMAGKNPQAVAGSPKPTAITSAAPAVDADDSDWSEDFIPLPDAEGAPPVENVQVVTVRLPASDLEEVGLPILEPAGPQYVTAEVVLGDDGIARAIRIAQ
ncbi:MAG: anti-sigma factor family protein [Terriglobia bacterium]